MTEVEARRRVYGPGFVAGRVAAWGLEEPGMSWKAADAILLAVHDESDGQEIKATWLAVDLENGI
jgi:hypothetical protein